MAVDYVKPHAEPKVERVNQVTVRDRNGRRALGIGMSPQARQAADAFLNHKQVCKLGVVNHTEHADGGVRIVTEVTDGCMVGKLCEKGRTLQREYARLRDEEFK